MPVSLAPGSVLRWPSAAEVLRAAELWAAAPRRRSPDLRAVGVFGSYGRGDAGVGSDLDLLLILQECSDPIWQRLRRWDTASLPVACDLRVYSLEEWRSLPGWNPRLAAALAHDTRWLEGEPLAAGESGPEFSAGSSSSASCTRPRVAEAGAGHFRGGLGSADPLGQGSAAVPQGG